jgi:L-lactate utilization protein LutC
MAFAWKFMNEIDLKNVEELEQKTRNILDNHQKLQNLPFEDLSDEEVKAMEALMKKYSKKLENAKEIITEFDQKLEEITKQITEK